VQLLILFMENILSLIMVTRSSPKNLLLGEVGYSVLWTRALPWLPCFSATPVDSNPQLSDLILHGSSNNTGKCYNQ
jgi:hypothetical protein